MKKIILTILIGLLYLGESKAYNTQVNLETHSGRFVLFVNGEKMNQRPAQQLRLNHLHSGKNNFRIKYWRNNRAFEVRRSVFLKPGFETSFNVKFNRYGEIRIVETGSFRIPGHSYNPGRYVNNKADFRILIDRLKSKRFDNQKFVIASRYIDRNNLTSGQLARIVRQFSFDNTKVDYVLNAYDFLHDPHNLHLVYDEFRFGSSVKTIRQQLRNRKDRNSFRGSARITEKNKNRNRTDNYRAYRNN
ncbi:MAG: DUF4476 domain-containing protein [Cyclobacteriaceae bacterium]